VRQEREEDVVQLVEETLFYKADHGESKAFLTASLGHEVGLVQKAFGGTSLSHRQVCKSLVSLHGLDILRYKDLRKAIVRRAHDDQISAAFAVVRADGVLKSYRDFSMETKREEVAGRAWHPGSAWTRNFCIHFGLPIQLAGREIESSQTPFFVVEPFLRLPGLHDFQCELQAKILAVLRLTRPGRALVALPTGAGKTRLLVDTALGLDSVARGERSVVWIAQHDELCEQAVQSFAQVWRSEERPGNRNLTIQRVWKGLSGPIDWSADIIIGTPESLVLRLGKSRVEERSRVVLSVVDEAHHALAPSYQPLFSLLSQGSIIGITATPGSAVKSGAHRLTKMFDGRLLTAESLEPNPYGELQRRGILAEAVYDPVKTNYRVAKTILDTDSMEQFGDLPPLVLDRLGKSDERNEVILRRLMEIDETDGSVLCFASSVTSARALAATLAVAGRTARSVDATSDRWSRSAAIEDFRCGRLQFLLNYGVLATGFDAPKVNALFMARPTTSPVLFEQMLGRGLRGPLNGGTEKCTIVAFEDDFTEFGGVRPLSYTRFMEQ
jgi:DNA repair protein RadD